MSSGPSAVREASFWRRVAIRAMVLALRFGKAIGFLVGYLIAAKLLGLL
jgi:hypothetical protein